MTNLFNSLVSGMMTGLGVKAHPSQWPRCNSLRVAFSSATCLSCRLCLAVVLCAATDGRVSSSGGGAVLVSLQYHRGR